MKEAWYKRHPVEYAATRNAWRKCNRESVLKATLKNYYGLAWDTYQELLAKQKGLCACCGCKPNKRLTVDHDHTTGRIRGLLCQTCNTGLGMFKDNPDLLKQALKYLKSKG